MLRIKRNESQSCLTVIAFSKNNILISGDLWVTPCSGNCKTTSYFNTMLPAVVVFFLSVWSLLFLLLSFLWDTFAACVTIYLFNFSYNLFFLLRYESRLWWYLFFLFCWFAWFLVSSSWYFAWLDLTLRLFLLFIYLPFFLCWLLWWY